MLSSYSSRIVSFSLAIGTVLISYVIFTFLKKHKKDAEKNNGKSLKTLQDHNEKILLPLIEIEEISHDTKKFRFGLPSSQHVLGLPIGQHIHLTAMINDELVIRSYTPVTSDDDRGYVDLVIKVYKRGVNPKFPNGGKMSQYLDNMKIGETIAFRGPSGKLQYNGNGKFQIRKLRKDPPTNIYGKRLNMIAGGTGITPMLQLVREIVKRPEDSTICSLIFANQTTNDILLRAELEELAANYPDKFKLWYTLDNPPEGWAFSNGFVNDDIIKTHLFPPSSDVIVLMCGPPPMINFACQPNLDKLGYDAESRFVY